MQEYTTNWDLRTIHQPMSLVSKLFLLYLFLGWVFLFVRAGMLWHRVVRGSKRAGALLEAVLEKLRTKDFRAAAELVRQLPPGTLEAALSRNLGQEQETLQMKLSDTLNPVAVEYDFYWSGHFQRTEGLYRACAFTLLLTIFCFSYELMQTFRVIWEAKALSFGAVAGSLAENLVIVAAGSLLSGALYGSYAYFRKHLLGRRTHWEYFLGRARQS